MTVNLRDETLETKPTDPTHAGGGKATSVADGPATEGAAESPDSSPVLFLGLQEHEAAAIYPLMHAEALEGLCETLRKVGLIEAIVLHDGKVLEGRNRCRAIERLQAEGCEIEPRFKDWEPKGDETPYDYVIAVNSNRRHLTPDQQAAAACKYLPVLREQSDKRQAETRFKAGHSAGSQAVAKKSESPQKRDSRTKNANTTAGQLAAKFGISQHMANQAVALEKAVAKGKLPPAAIEEVLNGTKISKVLARVEEDKSAPTPRASRTRQALGIHSDGEASAKPRNESAGTPLDPASLWGKPSPARPSPATDDSVEDSTPPTPRSGDDLHEVFVKAWAAFCDEFDDAEIPPVFDLVMRKIKADKRFVGPSRRKQK